METWDKIWGIGHELTWYQMTARGIAIFFIALILIRVSGRRSFGVRSPLDNIIVILLGAILSRAVVGISPFIPTVAASFFIVLLHRFFSWIKVRKPKFTSVIEGEKILLYESGKFIEANMKRALVCEEDIRQGIRESAQTEDLTMIDRIYIERNGKISIIKAKNEQI